MINTVNVIALVKHSEERDYTVFILSHKHSFMWLCSVDFLESFLFK